MTSSSPIYVVYLTTYRGNLLPPFYIGSSSMEKVLGGYGGSVVSEQHKKAWLKARREELDLFTTVILSEHSTRKAALDAEREIHLMLDVVNNPAFINMAIAGVYRHQVPHTDAAKAKMKAAWEKRRLAPVSDETREKLAAASRGKKRRPFSIEACHRMAEAAKKRAPPNQETRDKRSASMKARCSTPEAKAKLAAAGRARWA